MKVVGFSGEVQTFNIIGNPKKLRVCEVRKGRQQVLSAYYTGLGRIL